MAAPVTTFENYAPREQGLQGIYDIGADTAHPGVVPEMADAFGYSLDASPNDQNLGGLIAAVGSAKTLQDNIPGVQAALRTSANAVDIARGWVERSGLLAPVERPYVVAQFDDPNRRIDLMVMTGGVQRWMDRRAERLV